MKPGNLTHGKYTIDIEGNGCVVYALEGDEKVLLCGGIVDPEIAMDIVEGLVLVEAKRFYHPEAAPDITMSDGETVPHFLKRD